MRDEAKPFIRYRKGWAPICGCMDGLFKREQERKRRGRYSHCPAEATALT